MTLINHRLSIHLVHIRFYLCLTLAVNGGSNEYYLYSSMLTYSSISLFRKRVFWEIPMAFKTSLQWIRLAQVRYSFVRVLLCVNNNLCSSMCLYVHIAFWYWECPREIIFSRLPSCYRFLAWDAFLSQTKLALYSRMIRGEILV